MSGTSRAASAATVTASWSKRWVNQAEVRPASASSRTCPIRVSTELASPDSRVWSVGSATPIRMDASVRRVRRVWQGMLTRSIP
jgi:hypothetical protein